MKTTYTTLDGYRFGDVKICGYTFRAMITPHGMTQLGAPMGDTPEDHAMFDELVYHRQSVYNGNTLESTVAKVEGFIKNYKQVHQQLKDDREQDAFNVGLQ